MVASKRYSHAMYFVEPNLLHRPGFSVGEDHSFASSAWARSSSPRIVDARIFAVCMAGFTVEKGAQVVPGASQPSVGGTQFGPHALAGVIGWGPSPPRPELGEPENRDLRKESATANVIKRPVPWTPRLDQRWCNRQ